MLVNPTDTFSEVFLLESEVYDDTRGYLKPILDFRQLYALGFNSPRMQINQTYSHRGVVRGMHWQCREGQQIKIIKVVNGFILDIVVDVRKNSPTFGKWAAFRLSPRGPALCVPRGFAHGFQALEDSEVIYCCDAPHDIYYERSFDSFDSDVGLPWSKHTGHIRSLKDQLASHFHDVPTEAFEF